MKMKGTRWWFGGMVILFGGVFTVSGQLFGRSSSLGVDLADLDLDGDLDAFVANTGPGLTGTNKVFSMTARTFSMTAGKA